MSSQEETTLCPNCDQNIEKSKFFLHERMCSQNVKKCLKCNKPFNIDDLNEHIKSFHSYTICDLCNIKFPNSELEEHKKNCLYQLIPCKFCELNVLLKELEEHEEICGSTTQQCSKCGLYIAKRNFSNHICLNKETEFFNENIKIDNEEDVKKEKKMIKHGLEKNTYKKNKAKINFINNYNINDFNKKEEKNKKSNKNEIVDDYIFYENKGNKNKKKGGGKKNKKKQDENINIDNNENINDIDLKDFYTPQEIKNQIKAFNRFEKINYINNNNDDNNKQKKRNKKNKNKEKEKEVKEKENENEIKPKKGKKFKNLKNIKINKNEDNKYFDEEDYYIGNKNLDLHNIKWDIPPDKFKNYNNVKTYDYGLDYNLEENLLQEAIKLSLIEK